MCNIVTSDGLVPGLVAMDASGLRMSCCMHMDHEPTCGSYLVGAQAHTLDHVVIVISPGLIVSHCLNLGNLLRSAGDIYEIPETLQ